MSRAYDPGNLDKRFNKEAKSWETNYKKNFRHFSYNDKLFRRKYVIESLGSNPGLVLDLGCGAGSYFAQIVDLGSQVVGMDSSTEMVKLAKLESEKLSNNAFIVKGDALNLPFSDATFDSIIVVGLLEYLPNDKDFLDGINRILKPGGKVVITLRNELCLERRYWNFLNNLGIHSNVTNYWYRSHNPHAFKAVLKEFEFSDINICFCHFYPFPWPFGRILRPINSLFSVWMENRFNSSSIDWLASTMVVSFKKKGSEIKSGLLSERTFYKILRCPESGDTISKLDLGHLQNFNEKTKKHIKAFLSANINSFFISDNQEWIYPTYKGIPIIESKFATRTN